tara:strand:+ start:4380 stop:4874 length:495 start_codon:yes stop_codon:yes gene_type:complete
LLYLSWLFFGSNNSSPNANVVLDGSGIVSVERSLSSSGNSHTVELSVSSGSEALNDFIVAESVPEGSDLVFSDPEVFIESDGILVWVIDSVSEDFTISYEIVSSESSFSGKFGYEYLGELYEGDISGEGSAERSDSEFASRLNRWITEDKSFWESFLDFIFKRR